MAAQLVLRAARGKWVGILLLSVGFVVVGVMMVRDGKPAGTFVAGFFGLCSLVALVALVRPSELRLDAEGLSFGRRGRIGWRAVARFRVGHIGFNKMVLIDYAPAAGPQTARKVAQALTGAEGALPDTYGMKAEALAALLEEWRQRHGAGR